MTNFLIIAYFALAFLVLISEKDDRGSKETIPSQQRPGEAETVQRLRSRGDYE